MNFAEPAIQFARLAAIVESSDDAIIAKNLDGIITDWNSAAERLFGYLKEEAVGSHISLVAPPDRPDEMPAILARIKAGGKVEHFDTQRRHKDGHLVDISLTISPIVIGNDIIGASKIARDISHQIETTKRLRELLVENTRLLHENIHRTGNNLAVMQAACRAMQRKAPQDRDVIQKVLDELIHLSDEHMARERARTGPFLLNKDDPV